MAKKNPRLQFTDAELNPKLREHVRHAENAADQADAARAKIPKDKSKLKRRMIDQRTEHAWEKKGGRSKTTPPKPAAPKPASKSAAPKKRLYFEEVDKPKPPSKLSHTVKAAPGVVVSTTVHRKVQQVEKDNVGVESAHKLEMAAETGGRIAESAYHARKLKPYRQSARAEQRLEKANVNLLYQKHIQDNPQLVSNPLSRWRQKQAIRKQYAASVKSGQSTAAVVENTAAAAKKAAKQSKNALDFIRRHKSGIGIVLGIFFALTMLLNCVSSCTALLQGGLSVLGGTTFPAADGDMLAVEAAYAAMEANLQSTLDSYESTHDYDEYVYDLDAIKHDPYVLISLLTAYHHGTWTLAEAQATLDVFFDRQYTLTETVTEETRVDVDGNPYTWKICTVKLDNFDLSRLTAYLLDEDGLKLYAGYMANQGNRPDLFPQGLYPNVSKRPDYTDYDVPPEALEDEAFAAMLKEAEKYLGYPYVWGGSSPATSFDCSGFVSWVVNHSGWNVGRLGAQGLYNICTPVSPDNAKPGDLVFFKYTYKAPDPDGVTHCGIYVGNNRMIHCGNPISYANLTSSYWQNHFFSFARLP